MSIQTEIDRLNTAKSELKTLLQANDVNVPAAATLDEYPALFAVALQGGATYLYKTTFAVDGWTGSGPYTQTATATPLAGAPTLTADFTMASGIFVEDTYPDETQKAITAAAALIDRSTKTPDTSALVCTTRGTEKPDCDVEVFFLAKKE